jgi:hypothetical protein
LFSFDLSGLDSNTVIEAAAIELFAFSGSGAMGALKLHSLTTPFVEGTGDGIDPASGAGSGATWLSRTGSEAWASPGGDYEAIMLSSVPGYDATAGSTWKTFPTSAELVARVQAALDAGQPLNLIVLSPATEAGTAHAISRIGSDDRGDASQRPKLTLTYRGDFLPSVSPGAAFSARMDGAVQLSGSASNQTEVLWTKVSGPGVVTFADSSDPATTVSFSQPGNYVLRLTATNALGKTSDEVAIAVVDELPQLDVGPASSGQTSLQIEGTSGLNYTIQASTNLQSWSDLITIDGAVTPFWWTDSETGLPERFYRVAIEP